MDTIKTKIIAVSPPRTGTMSMSKMMQILGFTVSHAPGVAWEPYLTRHDFISDTPVFMRSVILNLLNSDYDVKFIYMDKPVNDWVTSMRKVGLNTSYDSMHSQVKNGIFLNPHNACDYEALYDLMQGSDGFHDDTAIAGFIRHREWVMESIPKDRLLVYDFNDGWGPLCEFVGKDVPDEKIPHLNINTMFDKLV